MRAVVMLISILFVAASARAQTPAAPELSPDIQIVKYNWIKERLNWKKDPPARSAKESTTDSSRKVIVVRIPYDDGTAWQAR
jgi:hypothetical protein